MEILAKLKKAKQDNKASVSTDFGKLFTRFHLTSKVAQFEPLIKKVYAHYTKDTELNWDEKDLKDCIRWVNKIIDNGFDPREKDIIDVEPFFEIEIMQPWAAYDYTIGGEQVKSFFSIKGTIDLITRLDSKTIEIIDYKTGKQGRKNWETGKKKTVEDIGNDIQVRMYDYACHFLYPWAEQVIVTMNYVNDGGPFTVYFNKSDFDQTEEILKQRFLEIKNTEIPQCKKSWKCSKFCHFGRSTFEQTSITPLQVSGNVMTKCDQIDYVLNSQGIEAVMDMGNGNLIDNLDKYNQG